jgi:hypothetical protein
MTDGGGGVKTRVAQVEQGEALARVAGQDNACCMGGEGGGCCM